ncbi:MAG: hypothetical protein AAGB31_12915 [Bdellovibrio sp.]
MKKLISYTIQICLLIVSFFSSIAWGRFLPLENPAQQAVEKQVIQSPYEPILTCWAWSCSASASVQLREVEWQKIDTLFQPIATSAREERKQIRLAMGLFEKIVGELNGQTKFDLGAPNSKGKGKPGQTDCVDESTNSTRYLKFLKARGLLRFHQVTEIEMRFNKAWMPLLGQHFTATIQDLKTSQRYAVDTWWYDNGTPAVIQKLDAWLKRTSFDPAYVP